MPKVRCGECGLRFDAPNDARGKSVRCPDCDTRVRVPRVKKKAAKKRKRPVAEGADDSEPAGPDAFLEINLARVEDDRVRICPKCTKEVDEEDEECPHCGVNLETGGISEKQKKKFSRKGADPEEFIGNLWGDSFRFMGRQWKLGLRTTLYLSVFITGWFFCAHMSFWSTRMPPKLFWTCVGMLFLFGSLGWVYHLNLEVIRAAKSKKRDPNSDDIKFDLFQCISLGLRIAAYPIVVFLPFFWSVIGILIPIVCLPIAMAHMTEKYTYRGWLGYFQCKIFMKNAGATMMWFLVFLSAYVVQAILIIVVLNTGLKKEIYYGKPPAKLEGEWRQEGAAPDTWAWNTGGFVGKNSASWAKSIADKDSGFMYQAMNIVFVFMFILLFAPLIAVTFAFPSLMVARASGLFAYYRGSELEYINEHKDGEPAGFWVRYHASMVDSLFYNLAPFLVPAKGPVSAALWLTNGAVYFFVLRFILATSFGFVILSPSGTFTALLVLACFAPLVNFWAYHAVAESNFERATIGKAALGLVVSREDGGQLSMGLATARIFSKLIPWIVVGAFAFGLKLLVYMMIENETLAWAIGSMIGLNVTGLAVNVFAAFNPEKRALHDTMCKTRVTWRGLME